MKKYKLLANLVFILHLIVIVMLFSGAFLCTILSWYKNIFFPFLGTVMLSQLAFLGCPLTTLESGLRAKYNKFPEFSGSFTSFLVYKIFKIRISPMVTVALLIIFLFANILFFTKGGLIEFLGGGLK